MRLRSSLERCSGHRLGIPCSSAQCLRVSLVVLVKILCDSGNLRDLLLKPLDPFQVFVASRWIGLRNENLVNLYLRVNSYLGL